VVSCALADANVSTVHIRCKPVNLTSIQAPNYKSSVTVLIHEHAALIG